MKKTVALWLALALLLCGVCAGAEDRTATAQTGQSEGWRLSNDMSIDPVLFHDLLSHICPDFLIRKSAEKTGVLLNAIEPALTVTDDGLQLDIDINGANALSIGGARKDDDVVIGSSLFPSYLISVYTGKLMEIVSEIKPMTAKPSPNGAFPDAAQTAQADDPEDAGNSAEAAPSGAQPSDPGSDESLPVGQMSQYINITAPEHVEYQINGLSFDVMRTYGLDCDGLVGLWNTFVDWICSNNGIASLMDIAKQADLEINADQIKSLLPTQSLPRFSATYYASTATADRFITATASSEDGAKLYGDATIQITEYEVTANARLPMVPLDIDFELNREDGLRARLDVRGKEPLVFATFNTEDGSKGRLEINAAGTFLGSDFEVSPFDDSGEGLRLTANLYYKDNVNPLFREKLTLQPRGALTMDLTDARKTVVPITSLLDAANGYLLGFVMDILFNGIGTLLDATTNVLTEINQTGMEQPAAAPAA